MTGAARFCENCGVPLAPEARFCEACGAPVGQAPAAPSSPTTIHQPPREEATGRSPGGSRTPRKGLLLWASAAAAILLTAIAGYWLLGRELARVTPPVTTTENSRSAPPDASAATPGDARPTEIEQAAQTPAAATAVPASPELPPTPLPITSGATSAGSTYEPQSSGDVFAGGVWCNARNGSEWLERRFDGVYDVSEIRIGRAGTDVTTAGSRIVLNLQHPDGRWIPVDELKETNINWEKLSFGGVGTSVPSYEKVLSPRLEAQAFRMEFLGNGWFVASDIQIFGTRRIPSDKPTP